MRRAHEAQVTTGAGNTHGSESASGCATQTQAGGRAAAGRATKSVQATTSVGDGHTGRCRRAVAELIVQSASSHHGAMHEIVQWAARQDEMKIANEMGHTEKAQGHRRSRQADEIQTPQRERNRRGKTWEEDECWAVWEEGRSVGGVGGRAKNCR
jgi:hypothetical protein